MSEKVVEKIAEILEEGLARLKIGKFSVKVPDENIRHSSDNKDLLVNGRDPSVKCKADDVMKDPQTSSVTETDDKEKVDANQRFKNIIEEILEKACSTEDGFTDENESSEKHPMVEKNLHPKSPDKDTGEKPPQLGVKQDKRRRQGQRRRRSERVDDADAFKPPSESRADQIKKRCEWIFEDFNVLKNSYLLNRIGRDGFISLKLVSSFRKLKGLTRNWRELACSLENSGILELNEDKTKVRRRIPIPRIEDTSYGKTVIVFNLPQQNELPTFLKELFGKFGPVKSLEVCGSESTNAYHRRCLFFHDGIASETYAAVEFETYEDAVSACKDEESHLPKENKMIVVPLMPQVFVAERRHLKFLKDLDPNKSQHYDSGSRGQRRAFRRSRAANGPAKDGKGRSAYDPPKDSRLVRNLNYNQMAYYQRPYRGRGPLYNGVQKFPVEAGDYGYHGYPGRQLMPSHSQNLSHLQSNGYRRR